MPDDIVSLLRANMNEPWMTIGSRPFAAEAAAEIERLRKVLTAARGYLTNAKIDLETGAPKRTAIMTIDGGLKMIREALPQE